MDYAELQAVKEGVRERYPNVSFPNPVLEPVWYGRRNLKRIPGERAIVDQNNGHVMNLCSDQYKLVHYEEIIKMVEDTISHIDSYGKIVLCPHIMHDGGKMRLTMKFPEAQHLVKAEAILPKIDVLTSYDLSYKLMGKFGAFILRCTNGMGVWKNFRQFARKHLLSLNILELEQTIVEGLGIFGLQVDNWSKWSDQVIDLDTYNGIWEVLPFSAKERERIEILPETATNLKIEDALKQKELTVWDLNSVLTQWNSHEIKSDVRRIDLEPIIAQAMENLYERLAA